MLQKTLPALLAGLMLGSVAASNAALAQLGPPPGPPPMLAGPPPGFAGPPPGPGGPRPGFGAGGPALGPIANLRARGPAGALPRNLAGGAYSANSYARRRYTSEGYGRGYRYWPYAAAAAAYAYDRSYASSGDGCYYVASYRGNGGGRVLVCHGD